METPVALTIFDRPTQTKRVFDAIREAKPEILLVIADGPRNAEEKIRCDTTRAIIDSVDWKCEVRKNYSEVNLGCRKRLSSGLNWVFEEVDRAIIFEADCLPDPSFFPFCEELLEKYKDNERIMHISGNFFQHRNKNFKCDDSYYFSVIPHIWGFATWRRAWEHYDPDIKKWPLAESKKAIQRVLTDPAVFEYWETIWEGFYKGETNSWDGQWTFACMLNGGLSINPCVNLVTNIGFGPDAMQGKDPNNFFANIPLKKIDFPLKHPDDIKTYAEADNFIFNQNFKPNRSLRQLVLRPFKKAFPNAYAKIKNTLAGF
jgi:hypothetical protein